MTGLIDINGCICIECEEYKFDVSPHLTKKNKFWCGDCKKKRGKVDGDK